MFLRVLLGHLTENSVISVNDVLQKRNFLSCLQPTGSRCGFRIKLVAMGPHTPHSSQSTCPMFVPAEHKEMSALNDAYNY